MLMLEKSRLGIAFDLVPYLPTLFDYNVFVLDER